MESIGRKQLVRRLPEITLGLLMLICAVLLLSLTAPISFLSDEWRFIYFRQGFERGYRDAYYGRNQYGRYDNNGVAIILPVILSAILGFQNCCSPPITSIWC